MTPTEVLAAAGLTSRNTDGTEVVSDGNGDWVWHGWIAKNGYGYDKPEPKVLIPVHRAVYLAVVGEIRDGWHVDHVWGRGCRSRACFRPYHLEAVTLEENARRAGQAKRERGPRSCGHSWADDRPGRSDCAACHREDGAARKAPQKAAYEETLRERTAKIKAMDAAGASRKDIASELGCSVETVRRTLLGLMKRY